ncbi:hypothetical protein ACIQB5_30485 [Streptomyces sp. NPDC088560]|uniref:hypothetical protein n=2 Tax=unclassified Streptomyces TaxID=2593676 RepID=UPI003824B8A7
MSWMTLVSAVVGALIATVSTAIPVDADVHVGRPVEIWGWAWAHEPVTRVDVSVDGGQRWTSAEVTSRTGHAWQRFTLTWTPSSVGEHILACRATTNTGATQPSTPRRNRTHQRVVFVTQEKTSPA